MTTDNARLIVKAAGFQAFSESRFPYTYHHDWVRAHSYAHGLVSRSDVAAALAEKHGSDQEAYDRECIRGALLYLAQYPDFVRAWMGMEFRQLFNWAMGVQ